MPLLKLLLLLFLALGSPLPAEAQITRVRDIPGILLTSDTATEISGTSDYFASSEPCALPKSFFSLPKRLVLGKTIRKRAFTSSMVYNDTSSNFGKKTKKYNKAGMLVSAVSEFKMVYPFASYRKVQLQVRNVWKDSVEMQTEDNYNGKMTSSIVKLYYGKGNLPLTYSLQDYPATKATQQPVVLRKKPCGLFTHNSDTTSRLVMNLYKCPELSGWLHKFDMYDRTLVLQRLPNTFSRNSKWIYRWSNQLIIFTINNPTGLNLNSYPPLTEALAPELIRNIVVMNWDKQGALTAYWSLDCFRNDPRSRSDFGILECNNCFETSGEISKEGILTMTSSYDKKVYKIPIGKKLPLKLLLKDSTGTFTQTIQ